MKRMLSAALLVLAAVALAQGQPGKPNRESRLSARQRAAQAEMEKAQDAYDVDELAQAELHAKKAAELDPSNKDALLFIAQVIERQYNRMEDGAERMDRTREALQAFQRVLTVDPLNDEAFNAVKVLYGELNEEELQYAWVMQRTLTSFPAEKRADAYLTLEWLDSDCAGRAVERASEKLSDTEAGVYKPERLDDETAREIAKGQQCISRGLQMAEQVLALEPANETAWQGKAQLLNQAGSLSEMQGQETQGEQYRNEALEAQARASEVGRQREEAERERAVKIDCGELCNKVINTPKPDYPAIARTARAGGAVAVLIVIDEDGNVISATVVSGHPLLRAAAVQAARLATFAQTLRDGLPVRATGTLTYNFTPPKVSMDVNYNMNR